MNDLIINEITACVLDVYLPYKSRFEQIEENIRTLNDIVIQTDPNIKL
jgi:hypothetical protein